MLVGLMVGWLVGWLVACFLNVSVRLIASWFVSLFVCDLQLAGWCGGELVCWLAGWLVVGMTVCWLAVLMAC